MNRIRAMDSLISLKNVVITLALTALTLPLVSHAEQSFRTRAHIDQQLTASTDDIKAEINFGRNIAARILGRLPLLKDEKLTRYVNLVGKSLALHSARTEIDYYFAILDSSHVNAYSAPGGYIFITTGALMQMEDEAELAAVLAHEIAHITEKHIVNTLKIKANDNSTTAGIGQILGASTNTTKAIFTQVVDKAINILFEQGYQHQDEISADSVGLELLATTGYDPMALPRYLSRLQNNLREHPDNASSTHPPTQARLTNLTAIIEADQLHTLALPKATDRFKHYVTYTK